MMTLKPDAYSSVVVTGGTGFVGSHIVDALLAKGYVVFALDNLLTGNETNFLP